MLVRQIMNKSLVTALPTTTVHEAARQMMEYNVGSILVVEEGGKLKGILTDRDIALAVAANSKDPGSTFVSDIMTPDPITISPDADIDSAIRIMHKAHIRRLPVVDNGKLVGFLSADDIANALKWEFDQFMGIEGAYTKQGVYATV